MGPAFSLLLIAIFIGMAAAQGAIVFGTARLALSWMRWTSNSAKLGLMAAAYLLWAGLPIAAYSSLGGDGGLMDGFGLVLVVAFAGLVGTFGWAVFWVLRPSLQEGFND